MVSGPNDAISRAKAMARSMSVTPSSCWPAKMALRAWDSMKGSAKPLRGTSS